MRRKEVRARTIAQDNDASCHNRYSNGHKNRAGLKRSSSKRLRQALQSEDEQLAEDGIKRV